MVKRIRGILSRILVRENYFFDRRGGARWSRKVGSGLTEGISRYKAELYTTRLRSNLFASCARGDLPRKFKGSLANIVSPSPRICNPPTRGLCYETASRWDCPNGPVKSTGILHGDHKRDSVAIHACLSSTSVISRCNRGYRISQRMRIATESAIYDYARYILAGIITR